MEVGLQEGDDSEEAMGEDHCHHGPSLVAPSPSDGRYSYLHPSLNKNVSIINESTSTALACHSL